MYSQTVENPITGVSMMPAYRSVYGFPGAGRYTHGTQVDYNAGTNPSCAYITYPMKYIPYNTHGAMVTGLNVNSTLRIRLRVYVEVAPTGTANDTDLTVLTTPSAGYDASALKVYSEVCSKMPVAVPVDFNSWGDWWKTMSSIIKTVAIPAGTAIGAAFGAPTAGAAVGTGVNALTTGLDQVFRSRAEPKYSGPVPETQNPGSVAYKKENSDTKKKKIQQRARPLRKQDRVKRA